MKRLSTAKAKSGLRDAILDRLVHNAHALKIRGESQRKNRSTLTLALEFVNIR